MLMIKPFLVFGIGRMIMFLLYNMGACKWELRQFLKYSELQNDEPLGSGKCNLICGDKIGYKRFE